MKKFLVPFCLVLSGACALAAVACDETTHTVTFNAHYGQFDDASNSRTVIVKNKKPVEQQTPTREGWKFEYWALNGEAYDFSQKVEGSFTLDAVYSPVDFHTVSFATVEGATFHYEGVNYNVTDLTNVPTIDIKVTVELDAFYAGTPVLMANDTSYNPVDGAYIIPIKADTTITAVGVNDDVSSIETTGTGSSAEPFLVSRPIDLLKIAEKVNAGDEVFRTAYYELQNDIDFKGHEIDVIGNGKDLVDDYAYFAGSFNGMGYTLKNFEINSTGSEYVGLFGIMNTGSVTHLNLENYEINATVQNSALYCGSFVGYGIGANVLVCGAENGEINVHAAENYFSYVGGAIGFQFSAFDPTLDVSYVSAASYLSINTEIYANTGLIYSAGGVIGYASGENEYTPSYVNHCYTDSIVTGAVISGGVVGYLGRYASVVDCYATGDVLAQNPDSLGLDEFDYVYAGGLVGYAENDTLVFESFATGSIDSYSSKGSTYENVGDVVGGFDAENSVEMGAKQVLLQNCYYALGGKNGSVDLTSSAFLKNTLNWREYDWTFVDGAYPTVNLEGESVTFKVTIDFGAGNTVDGYTKNVVPITDIYMPFGMWVKNGDFKASLLSDDGKIAVGYYFDETFQNKVPAGYIPTRNVTLYANFSDYSEVAGQYFLMTAHASKSIPLTLHADGTFEYDDGNKRSVSTYLYDDKTKTVLFQDARFARYAKTDDVSLNRYTLRAFAATLTNGDLTITDNLFFDAQSPLVATKGAFLAGEYYRAGSDEFYTFYSDHTGVRVVGGTETAFTYALDGSDILIDNETFGTYVDGVITVQGTALSTFDAYKGVWEKTSTHRVEYTFDGMGNWSKIYYVNVVSGNNLVRDVLEQEAGTYSVSADGVSLYVGSTLVATAAFDENGFLTFNNVPFFRRNSYQGVWQDFYHGVTLTLDGIGKDGYGLGAMLYDNQKSDIYYVAEEDSDLVTVYKDNDVFLTFTADEKGNSLIVEFNLEDQLREETVLRLFRYDEYFGEWISDDNPIFEIVSFNGFGAYNLTYTAEINSINLSGELTLIIDGDSVRVPYSLENSTSLNAEFTYEGIHYTLSFDFESGNALVRGGTQDVVLERKDAFANVKLVDENGNVYSFDGRGNLDGKGTATVRLADGSEETLLYAVNGDGLDFYAAESPYDFVKSIASNGTTYYVVGQPQAELKLYTVFTGNWALSGSYELLVIHGEDLTGNVTGVYKNTAVSFEKVNDATLKFNYNGSDLYVIALEYDGIALSNYPAIYADSYVFGARVDDLFGDWKKTSGPFELTLSFDGMSASNYAYGRAVIKHRGTAVQYYYIVNADGTIVLSAVQALNYKYYNYVVKWVDSSDSLAYHNGDRYFRLIEIDSLYNKTLTANDVDYSFDGQGTATDENGNEYEYVIKEYTENGSKVTVILKKDGVSQEITFNVSN